MHWFGIILWYDPGRAIPWQALFWVAMVVCLGLGAFYAIVWMNASGPNEALALNGLRGCAMGLGAIFIGRAIVWFLTHVFDA